MKEKINQKLKKRIEERTQKNEKPIYRKMKKEIKKRTNFTLELGVV